MIVPSWCSVLQWVATPVSHPPFPVPPHSSHKPVSHHTYPLRSLLTLSLVPNILQSTGDAPSSRVMLLLNMVTPEELYVDADYNDIVEDINDECGKYGEVEGVRIPRPVPKSKKWEPSDSAAATIEKNRKADEKAGVGRVYVMYRDIASTAEAMKAIGGRQFAGRTILVASVPEVRLVLLVKGFGLTAFAGRVPWASTPASSAGGYGRSCRSCSQRYHGWSHMMAQGSLSDQHRTS